MKSDIALAIIGALIGVTIGQFKGDMISNRLSSFFRDSWQRVLRAVPGQNDSPAE
jgi:hypothetical protein